jgi:hypothetical protein
VQVLQAVLAKELLKLKLHKEVKPKMLKTMKQVKGNLTKARLTKVRLIKVKLIKNNSKSKRPPKLTNP